MRFVAATLYAVSVAVLLGCVFASAFSGLTPTAAGIALIAGGALGIIALWRERHLCSKPPRLDAWGLAALVAFALFSLRAFLWLVFREDDSIAVLSPNNLGDLSLHLTYVRYFAAGVPFWPENPIFSGEPLTYPLGIDLFNSLLVLVGVDELRGFIWAGLIGSACTAAALWNWGRGFAVASFLFAGGLFGFAFLRTGEFLDYQSEAAWKSLPLALFVTQRGLLYALPAGLLLLASWRKRFLKEEPHRWSLPLWGETLLYASMPIFHLHTFLFLSVVAGVIFLAVPVSRRDLGLVVGAAFLPATLQTWCVTGRFRGASVLGWNPGWMQGEENFFTFWMMNFGVWPILVGALVFRIVRGRCRAAAVFVGPALAMFLVCCFVKFAAWEWDNTKLMLWSYLVIQPWLWTELLARWPEWARVTSCTLLFFSGAISLFGGISGKHTGYSIAQRSELAAVASAVRAMPITERFIGYPTYNHPLLLNGRILAMGYHGHAWSHGLDWQPRARTVESILDGEQGWNEKARALGVRYVFWGREEQEHHPDSLQPWRETTQLVTEGEWGALYDLTKPALPQAR